MTSRSLTNAFARDVPRIVPRGKQARGDGLTLERSITLIGSAPGAKLRLVAPSVSRCHAVIVNAVAGLYFRDLGSRAGVFVNGRRLREGDLRDGDEIAIASFSFRIVDPGDHVRTRPPAPHSSLEVEGSTVPIHFCSRTLLIGRRASCDVPLQDMAVSNAHALIYELNGGYVLRDLLSRSGTWVNGKRVKACELVAGDVIRVGNAVMSYVVGVKSVFNVPLRGDASAPVLPDIAPDDSPPETLESDRQQTEHRVPACPPILADVVEPIVAAAPLSALSSAGTNDRPEQAGPGGDVDSLASFLEALEPAAPSRSITTVPSSSLLSRAHGQTCSVWAGLPTDDPAASMLRETPTLACGVDHAADPVEDQAWHGPTVVCIGLSSGDTEVAMGASPGHMEVGGEVPIDDPSLSARPSAEEETNPIIEFAPSTSAGLSLSSPILVLTSDQMFHSANADPAAISMHTTQRSMSDVKNPLEEDNVSSGAGTHGAAEEQMVDAATAWLLDRCTAAEGEMIRLRVGIGCREHAWRDVADVAHLTIGEAEPLLRRTYVRLERVSRRYDGDKREISLALERMRAAIFNRGGHRSGRAKNTPPTTPEPTEE